MTEWTMRDGAKIKLVDMEISHIENCIKMLEKTIREIESEIKAGYQILSVVSGEMAQWQIEGDLNELEGIILRKQNKINAFKKELERREL